MVLEQKKERDKREDVFLLIWNAHTQQQEPWHLSHSIIADKEVWYLEELHKERNIGWSKAVFMPPINAEEGTRKEISSLKYTFLICIFSLEAAPLHSSSPTTIVFHFSKSTIVPVPRPSGISLSSTHRLFQCLY